MSSTQTARIRGVLFDKDGTLLDFNGTWLQPYHAMAEYLATQSGGQLSAADFLIDGGYLPDTRSWQPDSLLAAGSNQQIFDRWAKLLGAPLSAEQLRSIGQHFQREGSDYVGVIADLGPCLEGLVEQGFTLGVATMDDERQARSMLGAFEIAHLFEFVCGADSGFGVKPEPGMVLAFCERTGLRPEEVAMVGDSPRDIQMGINAGAGLSIGVTSGAHDGVELGRYTRHVLQDIGALTRYLQGQLPGS